MATKSPTATRQRSIQKKRDDQDAKKGGPAKKPEKKPVQAGARQHPVVTV